MNQAKTDAREISDLRTDRNHYASECSYLRQAIETAEQHLAYGRYDEAEKILYTAVHTSRALIRDTKEPQ